MIQFNMPSEFGFSLSPLLSYVLIFSSVATLIVKGTALANNISHFTNNLVSFML